jgi:hypothetical protein
MTSTQCLFDSHLKRENILIKSTKKMEKKLTLSEYKSKCLEIVESLLTEESIAEKEFIEKCEFLTKNYYNDIITERSLIDLCGYGLCQNKLSFTQSGFKSSQKYRISIKYNKVFEITERKMFCSNLCFKSSNYLREQLNEEPIYWTNDSSFKNKIHLFKESVGQLGYEVVFDEHIISESNIGTINNDIIDEKCVSQQKSISIKKSNDINSVGFPYIKEEYLDQLKDQMKGLTISEKFIDIKSEPKDSESSTKSEVS